MNRKVCFFIGITYLTEAMGGCGGDEERTLTSKERVKRGAYGLVMSLLNYAGVRKPPTLKCQRSRGTGALDDVVKVGDKVNDVTPRGGMRLKTRQVKDQTPFINPKDAVNTSL